jgi:hypothetical protein
MNESLIIIIYNSGFALQFCSFRIADSVHTMTVVALMHAVCEILKVGINLIT